MKAKPVPITISATEHMWRICENLTLIFIALRLADFIDWPMWKILLPIFIPSVVCILIGIIIGVVRSTMPANKEQQK